MLKETDEEYLLLEESFRDMSVEQVNRTLNESQAALDMLQTEAESLLELSTNPGDESALDIAKQMRAIQQKQRELMSMQMALQQRLAARSRKRKSTSRRGISSLKLQSMLARSELKEERENSESMRSVSSSRSHAPPPRSLDDAFALASEATENVVDLSPIKTPTATSASGAAPLRSGIVDVSPIASLNYDDGDDDVALEEETPRARDVILDRNAAASPPLVYSAHKQNERFTQPFESTASESVYESHKNNSAFASSKLQRSICWSCYFLSILI